MISCRDKIRNDGELRYADATLLSDMMANKIPESRPAKVAIAWITHVGKRQRYAKEYVISNSKKIYAIKDGKLVSST